jgi:hypothetical protein
LVKIFKTFRNYLIENYHVQAPGYTWVETWHILECMCKKCKQILQAYSLICTDYTIEALLFAVSVKNVKTTLVYPQMCTDNTDHNIHIVKTLLNAVSVKKCKQQHSSLFSDVYC